jgi:hypothetical protein
MDGDTGLWEDQGPEDISLVEREFHPLARLFVEVAICWEAAERNAGSFCSACTCDLGYHVDCDDGSCENCGCESVYWFCISCGNSRPLSAYSGTQTCKFCIAIPPPKIRPSNVTYDGRFQNNFWSSVWLSGAQCNYNRAHEARMALKELTE